MPRVKGGVVHARKRKRLFKRTKGFQHGFGKLYRPALEFARRHLAPAESAANRA